MTCLNFLWPYKSLVVIINWSVYHDGYKLSIDLVFCPIQIMIHQNEIGKFGDRVYEFKGSINW